MALIGSNSCKMMVSGVGEEASDGDPGVDPGELPFARAHAEASPGDAREMHARSIWDGA